MTNDIYSLVQTLNDIAERKQPSGRASRIVSALTPNPVNRATHARTRPQPAIDANQPTQHAGITEVAESPSPTLCA